MGQPLEVMVIPGTKNPADLIARDRGRAADVPSNNWKNSPAYLRDSSDFLCHHLLQQNGRSVQTQKQEQGTLSYTRKIKFPNCSIMHMRSWMSRKTLILTWSHWPEIQKVSCSKNREKTQETVYSQDYNAALNLLLQLSQGGMTKRINDRGLIGLGPDIQGEE